MQSASQTVSQRNPAFKASTAFQKALEALAAREGYKAETEPSESAFLDARRLLDEEFAALLSRTDLAGGQARRMAESAKRFEDESEARAAKEEKTGLDVLEGGADDIHSGEDESASSEGSDSESDSDSDSGLESLSDEETEVGDASAHSHSRALARVEEAEWKASIAAEARRAACAASMKRLREERRRAAGIPARELSTSARAVAARMARKKARGELSDRD